MRGGEIIGESKINALRKVREEVVRVERRGENGIVFAETIEFAVGDIIESFRGR